MSHNIKNVLEYMVVCIPVLVLSATVVAVQVYILLPEAELEEEVMQVADHRVSSLRRRHPLVDQVVDLLRNSLAADPEDAALPCTLVRVVGDRVGSGPAE